MFAFSRPRCPVCSKELENGDFMHSTDIGFDRENDLHIDCAVKHIENRRKMCDEELEYIAEEKKRISVLLECDGGE